ncbi:MAG: hypothetical protein PSX36_07455 [bacterium]|nr:hypothetical protein [bacterium]
MMIRRYLPFLLIFILISIVFRFVFFMSFVHFEKSEFRRKLLETKSKQVIELRFDNRDLFLDKNSFEWKKDNKELVINGQYHEVIRITKLKGIALVYVIADKAENELFKKYYGLNKTVHGNFTEIIKLLLNLTYLEPHFKFEPASEPAIGEKRTFYRMCLQNAYIIKLLKPPRTAIS